MPTKSMTLRLPETQAAELEMVARADHMPVSDVVRSAIAEHIQRRRKDKVFQAQLRRIMEEERDLHQRLAQ